MLVTPKICCKWFLDWKQSYHLGFTVPEVDKILAKYAYKSYAKYHKEYEQIAQEWITNFEYDQVLELNISASKYAMQKVERELRQGWQGIEYKLNTVGSSRGDYPFITMTFGLATDKFGKLISKVFLEIHAEGQGKDGFKKPVLFPKLVFLYDSEIHGEGKVCADLFETAIDCSAKTMYPDYLSLEKGSYVGDIYHKHGTVISPMGK